MKIIYDREKAISRKEEIDKEIKKENEWREKENRKMRWIGGSITAALIALIIGVCVYLCLFEVHKDLLPLPIGMGFVFVALVVIAAYVYFEAELWPKAEADYPANVIFLNKTDGYNVLQIYIKDDGVSYHDVSVDREDKNHKVETIPIASLKNVVYADLPEDSEPIADLETGEYKTPYIRKEKKNENYL